MAVSRMFLVVGACGYGDARFHLVGHDWGGSIAWALADRYPQRLASLSVLSRPHPNAFNRALQTDSGQVLRSRHHQAFLEHDAADVVLANNAKWLRQRLTAAGVPISSIEEHLSVIGNKPAIVALALILSGCASSGGSSAGTVAERRDALSQMRSTALKEFYATNPADASTIHHVGIYRGGGQMVEASYTGAQVRIRTIYRSGMMPFAGRP